MVRCLDFFLPGFKIARSASPSHFSGCCFRRRRCKLLIKSQWPWITREEEWRSHGAFERHIGNTVTASPKKHSHHSASILASLQTRYKGSSIFWFFLNEPQNPAHVSCKLWRQKYPVSYWLLKEPVSFLLSSVHILLIVIPPDRKSLRTIMNVFFKGPIRCWTRQSVHLPLINTSHARWRGKKRSVHRKSRNYRIRACHYPNYCCVAVRGKSWRGQERRGHGCPVRAARTEFSVQRQEGLMKWSAVWTKIRNGFPCTKPAKRCL